MSENEQAVCERVADHLERLAAERSGEVVATLRMCVRDLREAARGPVKARGTYPNFETVQHGPTRVDRRRRG